MKTELFTFGSGIEFVLQSISINSYDRQSFHKDAQVIQNAFIDAISRRDCAFKEAFGGLALTGSTLDKSKIGLPDEFDMLTKTKLPCIVKPWQVKQHPAFIFLALHGPNVPENLVEYHNGEKFLSRPKLQSWYRENIFGVMSELNNIQCENQRAYELKYIAHGYGVAHTLIATCRQDCARKIFFDFVPAFEFQVAELPRNITKPCNGRRTWFAVPRKFTDKNAMDDTRSFMICAPYWERMVLNKKQNLKDSMRLMKAIRNSNKMGRLISYMMKSAYLNAVNAKVLNCNQSPGRILIRMMVFLKMFLRQGFLPFYLMREHNVLSTMGCKERHEYSRVCNRMIKKLIKCRDKDCMTPSDMEILFGISY